MSRHAWIKGKRNQRSPSSDADGKDAKENSSARALQSNNRPLNLTRRSILLRTATEHGGVASTSDIQEDATSPDEAPEKGHLDTYILSFIGIPVAVVVLVFVAYGFDAGTIDGASGISFDQFIGDYLVLDDTQSRALVGILAQIMAAILGIILTVSAIAVQLAAGRFTSHITRLFFRDKTVVVNLTFFTSSLVYMLFLFWSIGKSIRWRWGILFGVLFLVGSVLEMFPYFVYLFDFLNPEKIIRIIMENGVQAAAPPSTTEDNQSNGDASTLNAKQLQAVNSIENLSVLALDAIQQKNKRIAQRVLDAMCSMAVRYGSSKGHWHKDWFRVSEWNRESPDFISLSEDAVSDLQKREIWLEWKILRQYQMLYNQALASLKDSCLLIAIVTRRFAEAAAVHNDVHALDLAIKFFNTYLRATINVSDIRTVYNVMHQYRQLCEFLLLQNRVRPAAEADALEERALDIVRFFRYYCTTCVDKSLFFVSEIIAYDTCSLCESAFQWQCNSHDDMLEVFSSFTDKIQHIPGAKGILRAQLKLALTYLVKEESIFAGRIRDVLLQHPLDDIKGVIQETRSMSVREFWEITERGTNMTYVTPDKMQKLESFTVMIDAAAVRPSGESQE